MGRQTARQAPSEWMDELGVGGRKSRLVSDLKGKLLREMGVWAVGADLNTESSIPSVRDLSEEEAALAPLFGPIWGLRGHIPLGRINLQRPACNEWLTVKSRLLIYSLCSQSGLLVSSTARGKSPIAPEATSLSGKIAWACRTSQGAGCMKTNYTKVA